MSPAALELESVCHRYGDRVALSNVSFELAPGEIVGLLGENGAGKTTLIRLIAELADLQTGRIARNVDSLGYVPQRVVIWPDLTVGEQLEFMCDMESVERSAAKRCAARVALEDRWNTLASELSGGMQRRLSIAMALLHQPRLLVLDEPNAGLDPKHRVQLREVLKELAHSGVAILVSSHDVAEIERTADRVVLLASGEVASVGTVAEVAGDGTLEERFR